MAEKIKTVLNMMQKIAPPFLAEEWDNVGFQIGNPDQQITKVMVCLEVTESIIEEAISENVGLIISHHPLIFKPLKSVHTDDVIGKLVYKLIQHNIGLYCAHTNLDIVKNGTSDVLAKMIGISNTKPLIPTNKEMYFKFVVFVPDTHLEVVRDALCQAGAGHIGNYSHCTFQTEGIGTFKPLEGTEPFIGKIGEIKKTSEYRLETIVPKEKLYSTISMMQKVHPYEEVAYDVIPLSNNIHRYGLGRVGELEQEMSVAEIVQKIKKQLGIAKVKFVGDENKYVRKIGVCTGSGAEFIHDAAKQDCDCYITGDVKYHDAQYALQLGMPVIDAGHFETENIVCHTIVESLKKQISKNGYRVDVQLARTNINPFQII